MNISSLLARLNDHPRIVFSVTGALILVAVVIGVRSCASNKLQNHISEANFVDEETLEAVSRPGTQVPPLIGASGRATLVYGVYWTCSDCKSRQLAYLQKYDDATRRTLQDSITNDPSGKTAAQAFIESRKGSLVRLPKAGSPWVAEDSTEGRAVVGSFTCPPGSDPRPCP